MATRDTFRPRCLPVEAWPTAFQEAWRRALNDDELFDTARVARSWRHSTLNKTRKGFGVWISWNLERLPSIESTVPVSNVTRKYVHAYIVELQSFCASNTVFCRAQELYDAIRIMEPDHDWSWLACAVKKLRSRAKPVREKLSRLKPADVVEKLGLDLMHRAEAESGISPFKRSLMFRDGLAIALLIRRPLRLRNFSNMKMHTHLVGEGFTRIVFSAAEMKGKRPFEAAFPANLQGALHRYLNAYRPHLLSLHAQDGSPGVEMALWISSEGRAVDPGAFSKSIARRTRAAFGRDLTPHLFRDASVTTLIRDAPASALLTKTILSHSSIDVTFDHYNQAQMVESSRRYAEVVAALQQKEQGAD